MIHKMKQLQRRGITEMSYTIQLNHYQVIAAIRQMLIEDINYVKNDSLDDEQELDVSCLEAVLKYYSTREEWDDYLKGRQEENTNE